jgi:hypothetical protein
LKCAEKSFDLRPSSTLKKDKIEPAAAVKTAPESCRRKKIDRSGVGNGPRSA